jgi:UDP-2,3-diacylglucosamine hydrolase
MSTLFVSDLHLEDGRPDSSRLFLEFLAGPARGADALYVLGDLFEFWIGDDAVSPTATEVARALSGLSQGGVPVHFMHGNRDFLLGEHYAEQAGMQLLPEQLVVELHGTPTLLLHGDTLCTDDVEYQAFRRQSRDPAWQAAVLTLSVEERLQMARSAREASSAHMAAVSMEITDVNEEAVLDAFQGAGVQRMIHGHTHRPAFHNHRLRDGATGERAVLSDWYRGGSYLEVSGSGMRPVEL